MIFGVLHPEETWHHCTVAHLAGILKPLYLGKSRKVIFQEYYSYILQIFTFSQKKTNCYSLNHHT